MRILDVYLKGELVGKLTSDAATLSFSYEKKYLDSGTPTKLSASLPLQEEKFDHHDTNSFFSGLLPDAHVREKLAQILKVSKQNTFSLLERIGGECAGAISLHAEGVTPADASETEYKVLGDDEADEILSTLDRHPMLADDDDIRISGAGAQDKLMISFVGGKVAIPMGSTPSTHIIKPAIQKETQGLIISDSVHNEFFCMRLAKEVGLPVPEVKILWIKDKPYYVIERYDREIDNGRIKRLHQEDFCQALHIPPEMKYQNDGGPSLENCFDLLSARIKSGSMSGVNKIVLLQCVIFNFLVGNGDAHGKNFSILYKDDYEELSPFYDILSTLVYANAHTEKMAMKLGTKYKFKEVSLRHIISFGESVGFKEDFIKKQVHMMAKMRIVSAAQKLHAELDESKFTRSPIYEKIIAVISKNSRQVLRGIS